MTQHILQGRTEDEILWFQRRGFLQAAAAWTAMGGFGAAQAQQRSNIVELRGDALLNGQRMDPQHTIQTGDSVETGPGSHLVFVIGNSAFQVRQNSRLTVERGATLNAVSVLRMLTGAVASVWGRGTSRQIVTPTLTAGIRGTGVYTEVFPQQNFRSYFCNCYGEVEMGAGTDKTVSRADYHQSFWGEPEAEERPLPDAGQGHQPHRRRTRIPRATRQPAHGLADRGQEGRARWQRVHGAKDRAGAPADPLMQ